MFSHIARQIFQETLLRIDAGEAVRSAVCVDGAHLLLPVGEVELVNTPIYVIAIGKAAYPMAVGLHEVVGNNIKGGVVSGILPEDDKKKELLNESKWKIFAGGHPLPNEQSLAAACACLDLLKKVDIEEQALIIFLISGGGSAMMELPRAEITLSDLRILNQVLVTSGASITEINAVRRAVSEVKGGGLALRARRAKQISLIISDTAPGDISSVASGPSLLPSEETPDSIEVIEKYGLKSFLPANVCQVLKNYEIEYTKVELDNQKYVLLDNTHMVRAATEIAKRMGFAVKTDDGNKDSFIVDGCEQLFERFMNFRKTVPDKRPICFISGGEFGCKVNGEGIGGRNCETVLRLALLACEKESFREYAILSAGTDGIDGNSPAAGAVADQTSLKRAAACKMNPIKYLENSDSFSFFNELGNAIITGATGTNVRDLRLLISK